MEISVIIPAYNEEEGISGVLKEMVSTLDGAKLDYEIIVVDDGSIDKQIAGTCAEKSIITTRWALSTIDRIC